MKKIILSLSIIIICLTSFIIIKRKQKYNKTANYTIGILQTASHPALDAACKGFIEELKNKMDGQVEFVIQNAQGSVAQAHAIAQQFNINKQFDGFLAIATPAAQALGTINKTKPIFITAVTDPNALGLLNPDTNICGTKDMIDVKAEIAIIPQLIPHAKTVGLLYTSGETNSVILVKQMRQELQSCGLTTLEFAVSNESDMPAMIELACRKADVILAPTDNTVASSISLIVSKANQYQKPLIVSDNMLVKFGALAARGVDYAQSGKQTAQIAYQVLVDDKKPSDLPIEQAITSMIYVNKETLDLLGLTIPKNLETDVVLVEE